MNDFRDTARAEQQRRKDTQETQDRKEAEREHIRTRINESLERIFSAGIITDKRGVRLLWSSRDQLCTQFGSDWALFGFRCDRNRGGVEVIHSRSYRSRYQDGAHYDSWEEAYEDCLKTLLGAVSEECLTRIIEMEVDD